MTKTSIEWTKNESKKKMEKSKSANKESLIRPSPIILDNPSLVLIPNSVIIQRIYPTIYTLSIHRKVQKPQEWKLFHLKNAAIIVRQNRSWKAGSLKETEIRPEINRDHSLHHMYSCRCWNSNPLRHKYFVFQRMLIDTL